MDDELASNFVAVTGADEQVARQLLDMANGDLAQAVLLYYETDVAETLRRQAASEAVATAGNAGSNSGGGGGGGGGGSGRARSRSSRPARRQLGREDENGVIHLDSDDDNDGGYNFDGDEMDVMDDDDDDDDDDANDLHENEHDRHGARLAQTVARTAQEEEDEAMAKRLQEEMYAETAATSDGIRAPIARTTEVLVEPTYTPGFGDYGSGGIGGGGSFGGSAEALYEQMRRRRRPARGPPNPFSQVWDNDGTAQSGYSSGDAGEAGETTQPTSRQARLADLFRPPYDIMEHMSWDEARSVGKAEKRWILANLQDMSDFQCQALNRDIWKDAAVRELVRENFIFLQFNKEDQAAESYIQYYMPGGQHENPDNYPHVAIIDPRTGEQVKVWSERPFPSAASFHAQLAEFLDRYSLDSTRKNPVQTAKARQPVRDVGRMTEEEMLEMALQNSLATSGGVEDYSGNGGNGGNGSGTESRPSLRDPDELTTGGDKGKGKGKESDANADADADADENAESSAFAQIASDHPHEEPANNPATTTRIQFRHPTGRVIRRFAAADQVLRIYEWLKAEPLEGKAGLEFELKVVPQGHDLIEDLDKTIEEAGLKQATVMIEFIE